MGLARHGTVRGHKIIINEDRMLSSSPGNIAGTLHVESQCCGIGFASSGISMAHEVIPHGTVWDNESEQQWAQMAPSVLQKQLYLIKTAQAADRASPPDSIKDFAS